MINHFCKKPLWQVSRILVDVAMGRRGADRGLVDCRTFAFVEPLLN